MNRKNPFDDMPADDSPIENDFKEMASGKQVTCKACKETSTYLGKKGGIFKCHCGYKEQIC